MKIQLYFQASVTGDREVGFFNNTRSEKWWDCFEPTIPAPLSTAIYLQSGKTYEIHVCSVSEINLNRKWCRI